MNKIWTAENNEQFFTRALAAINDSRAITTGEPPLSELPKDARGPVDAALENIGRIVDPYHFECFSEEHAARLGSLWEENRKSKIA